MNFIVMAPSIQIGTAQHYPSLYVPPLPYISLNVPPFIANETVEPVLHWFKPKGIFIGLRPGSQGLELVAFAIIASGDPELSTIIIGNVVDVADQEIATLLPNADRKLMVGIGYHRPSRELEFIDPERLAFMDHIDGPEVVERIEHRVGPTLFQKLLRPRAA